MGQCPCRRGAGKYRVNAPASLRGVDRGGRRERAHRHPGAYRDLSRETGGTECASGPRRGTLFPHGGIAAAAALMPEGINDGHIETLRNAGYVTARQNVDIVLNYGLTVRPIITGSMTVHFTERDFSGKKGAQRENQGRVGCPAGQQRYSGVLPENVLCCGCFILYTG